MKPTILKNLFIYVLISSVTTTIKAQQPTWENGIACIIYTHCSPCHNPQGIAPFSLMSYQDAFDWAATIRHVVKKGEMPPYPPDRSYQHYQNERYLSDSEKVAINQWVRKGAPSGNLNKAPSPPKFTKKSEIANPDFTAVIPTYTIPADATKDVYRIFVFPIPFSETKYISKIEVIPGDKSIVHHAIIFQDSSSKPVMLDAADPLPGYTKFGGTGSKSSDFLSGWTPSQGVMTFPPNMGIKVNAHSRILIQIHYPVAGAGKVDSTRINFKFTTPDAGFRQIKINRFLNERKTMINGPLSIPPNEVKTFYEQLKFRDGKPISLLGIVPHAHLLCRSIKSYAVTPDGDTVPLINIKKWDFHWQGMYLFKKMILLPGGSTLYGEAVYDNTVNNPDNPNNPPKEVNQGEASTDEMMMFWFFDLKPEPGDDNLVFDTTTRLPTYNNCGFVVRKISAGIEESIAENESIEKNSIDKTVSIYPNPMHDKLKLTLRDAEAAKVLIYNVNGQLVHETSARQGNNNQFDLQHLPNGVYIIKVLNSRVNTTLRFIKQ